MIEQPEVKCCLSARAQVDGAAGTFCINRRSERGDSEIQRDPSGPNAEAQPARQRAGSVLVDQGPVPGGKRCGDRAAQRRGEIWLVELRIGWSR